MRSPSAMPSRKPGRHVERAGSHRLEGGEIRVERRERAVVAERQLRDRLGPPRDPRARRRTEAREEAGHLGARRREEIGVRRACERAVERAAEERRRQHEARGRTAREERRGIEDPEGAEALHLRDESAEAARRVGRRRRSRVGREDDRHRRRRHGGEGGGRARQHVPEEPRGRRSRERRDEDVGVEGRGRRPYGRASAGRGRGEGLLRKRRPRSSRYGSRVAHSRRL